jgi:hypothetical protein
MKRFAKILIISFVSLLLIAILIPFIFKGKIQELIVTEFEKNTEATIYFDVDKFSLSLIKDFPDFTIGLGDFGVVGKGVFEGDTLVSVKELEARVNLSDILFGETISIKGVFLDEPSFMIITLADGSANYDIAKVSDTVEAVTEEEAGSVKFGINSFAISGGDFIYLDQSLQFIMSMSGVNLKGRGDFAEDIFDLVSTGSIEAVTVNYEGTEYLTNKSVGLDMVMSMDLPNSNYTFKENEITINDFPLHLDGSFQMLEDAYGMDITFDSPASEFKKILSLVPGVYTDQFKEIQASGNVAFQGRVFGKYSDNEMPAFNLALDIDNGQFRYPELTESINDVQLHLAVDNKDGVIENTLVDLKQMHVKFGQNPFDAQLQVQNLKDFPIKASLKGKLNLSDINKMIPMEGFSMAGILELDARADGKYDSLRSVIPVLDLVMVLKDGMISTPEISKPLEQLNLDLQVHNASGLIMDTKIALKQMNFLLDGQPFEAKADLENPENFKWDASVKGQVDLEKLFKLYPMEGVAAKGIIDADLQSSGTMADVEAKRYRNLSTKGDVLLSNFEYDYPEMGKTFSVTRASTSFSERAIDLNEMQGKAGETSFSMEGKLRNYLGFFLNGEELTGNLTAKANRLNVNEWMPAGEEEAEESTGEPLEVIRIPENIGFTIDTEVDEVVYSKLAMNDLKGKVVVSNGKIDLQNTDFRTLNGTVKLTGAYDSKPEKPTFDFGFKVKEVSIPASFQSLVMIQKLAPITESMNGLFSTDFSLKGALGLDMMPDYTTLTGSGLIQILEASLGGGSEDSKLLAGLSSVSKLSKVTTATLEKVKMSAEVRDGRLFVKPFDVKLGDYKTQVSGSTGIDGSIDYQLQMDVPAGKIGAQLNSLVSSLTKSPLTSGSNLKLNIGLANTFKDPRFSLKSVTTAEGETVQGAITASVKEKVDEKKEEVKAEVDKKVTDLKDSAKTVVDTKKEALQDSASKVIDAQKDSVAAKIADKLKVDKDSVDAKLKEKADKLLEGFLKKKKKKKNNDN